MRRTLVMIGCLAVLTALSACAEQPQVPGTRIVGTPAYMGAEGSPYTDAGWKAGDSTGWEEQLRTRTQTGQNEYVRSGGR